MLIWPTKKKINEVYLTSKKKKKTQNKKNLPYSRPKCQSDRLKRKKKLLVKFVYVRKGKKRLNKKKIHHIHIQNVNLAA